MSRTLTKEEWFRRNRRLNRMIIALIFSLFFLIILFSVLLIKRAVKYFSSETQIEAIEETLMNGTVVKKMYLSPNPFSRPGTKLTKVKGIVVHYTANPNTSAEANRNYFESLATTQLTSASSHYIIGLEGEIVQCIPLTEIAYASNERNKDTISIECCHEDETGKFNEKTYQSLVSLAAALCVEFDLEEEDIIRHYDVTKKKCPLYYVEHEDEWYALRKDILEEVEALKAMAKDRLN